MDFIQMNNAREISTYDEGKELCRKLQALPASTPQLSSLKNCQNLVHCETYEDKASDGVLFRMCSSTQANEAIRREPSPVAKYVRRICHSNKRCRFAIGYYNLWHKQS